MSRLRACVFGGGGFRGGGFRGCGALLCVPMLVSACDTSEDLSKPRPADVEPRANADAGAASDPNAGTPPPISVAGDLGGGSGDTEPVPEGSADEAVATGSTPETDRLAREVAQILAARCASCHDQGQSEGGLGDLHDFARAIEQGVIVPGAGAQSPLVLRMSDGSMPPGTASYARPSTGEIALVRRFIDRLPAALPAPCAALPFRSLDEVYTSLLADVRQAPAAERPYLRYVGLSYAANAGSCGPALERQRSALFKLVNSVSLAPDIHVPRAIDGDGTLYRVDLRNYGWDRDIDLEDDGSVDFADGWLAITALAGPYALELQGPEADAVKRETTAAVPLLPANALVHAASAGDLYYALVGVHRSVPQTQAALGVNLFPEEPDPLLQQAGFSVPSPLYRDVRVQRHEQANFPGRAYWVIEDEYLAGGESMYEDPLGFGTMPRSVIFSLPNGLQAYEMDGRDELRATVLQPDCSAGPCRMQEPRTIAGCHACHEAGLVPLTDFLRAYVQDNRVQFDNDTFEEVLRTFPTPDELDQVIQRDSQRHLDAVARAGVVSDGPEPISLVHSQFEVESLSPRRVAAELGVTQEQLSAQIERLDPRLAPLSAPEGSIERATLTDSYAGSLCVLLAGSKNRPLTCP